MNWFKYLRALLFMIVSLALAAGLTTSQAAAQEGIDLPAQDNPVFISYLPLVAKATSPLELSSVLYCRAPGLGIPDNDPNGTTDTLWIDDVRYIADLDVQLDIQHNWVGDLSVYLTHVETGRTLPLIDKPGRPASEDGCGSDHVGAILDDEITLPVENQCAGGPAAIAGIYRPELPLEAFNKESIVGSWTLKVVDEGRADAGQLNGWCIAAKVSNVPYSEPGLPVIPDLPNKAYVPGVPSFPQSLPLDCESRVAVDWAAYFGMYIGEMEFFNQLPHSDNPDAGFVGSVYGVWGQIPPNPYGVHAEPVAALLRQYGLPAYAHRALSWDQLKAEIASGRPVYVWTIGAASRQEIPVYYTSSDGHRSIVAHYEHTIMVVGYTDSTVTIKDGGVESVISIGQFLSSWSALGNMAITTQP